MEVENQNAIYPAARAYARENAQVCAQEIVAWRNAAEYKGHALRELADILKPLDQHHSMQMAEALVIEVALEKLASADEAQ